MSHPRILLSTDGAAGTTRVDDLRAAVERPGRSRQIWQAVRQTADAARDEPPVTPGDALPGRSDQDIAQGNRDYRVVDAAGQRVVCAALAAVLTGERSYVEAALRQMESLFDDSIWVEWQDIFHRQRFDLDADLRTGQLSRDLALAWDWMRSLLSDEESRRVVDGIDRRGIQPYLRAVDAGAWWVERMNNWTTVIVGGLGMAGMALDGTHPQAQRLVDLSHPAMTAYLEHYGPDGEFNENPSYANSSFLPALYFSMLRSHEGDDGVPPPIAALRRHAYWCLYATAPPGHLVSFGDGGPAYPALTSFVPAVAAATRDPLLQWFYLQYGAPPRFPVWELLWFDDRLQSQAPTTDSLPLGRAYDAHSGLISSRADWDPQSTPSVVFGKAGHGGVNHTHPDGGQIEVHGYGTPLIVDLGSVPYPGSEHERYYHFASDGHNQLSVAGRPQAWPRDGSRRARRTDAAFANDRGGWWRVDLTDLHEGVESVMRTVVHLLPATVVVLDEARLLVEETCRLRWHPATMPQMDAAGGFSLESGPAWLHAWVGAADGTPLDLTTGRHEYRPPYDRDRMGSLLPQRREPYIDAFLRGRSVRFVSLFDIQVRDGGARPAGGWRREGDGWVRGQTTVRVDDEGLHVTGSAGSWRVPPVVA